MESTRCLSVSLYFPFENIRIQCQAQGELTFSTTQLLKWIFDSVSKRTSIPMLKSSQVYEFMMDVDDDERPKKSMQESPVQQFNSSFLNPQVTKLPQLVLTKSS